MLRGCRDRGWHLEGTGREEMDFFVCVFFLLFLFYNMLYKNQNDAGDKEN